MNPEEDKIFLCVWLLYYVNNFSDSRMEVRMIPRTYQPMDINGFLKCGAREVFFWLKGFILRKQLDPSVACVAGACQHDSQIILQFNGQPGVSFKGRYTFWIHMVLTHGQIRWWRVKLGNNFTRVLSKS